MRSTFTGSKRLSKNGFAPSCVGIFVSPSRLLVDDGGFLDAFALAPDATLVSFAFDGAPLEPEPVALSCASSASAFAACRSRSRRMSIFSFIEFSYLTLSSWSSGSYDATCFSSFLILTASASFSWSTRWWCILCTSRWCRNLSHVPFAVSVILRVSSSCFRSSFTWSSSASLRK